MNKIIQNIKLVVSLVLIGVLSGCASRMDTPINTDDQSIIYQLKDGNQVVNSIRFCRKIDKKTGKLIGERDDFMIIDEGRVQAIVDLSDYILQKEDLSMFHFDWISSSGYTTYLKRVAFEPGDSLDYIRSSIFVTPGIRTPGEYKLRVYYFRELIAEKDFELIPEFDPSLYNLQNLSENFVICKKTKKNGKPLGICNELNQSNKGSIRASFKLDHELFVDQPEQLYRIDWFVYGDTVAFFRKHIDVLVKDSLRYISSSISISPEKRAPGQYLAVLNLFGKPIAQKEFTLLPPLDYSAVKADIILYKKKSKKSGKLHGKGTQFEIGEKKKVRAQVNLSGLYEFKGKELECKLRWVGPDGKSVYSKSYDLTPKKSTTTLSGSISITPGKRKPGEYSLKIYLSGELIGEQKFELQTEK